MKKQNESLKTRESRNEPDQDEEFTSREFKEDTYHMSDLAIRNVNNSIVSEYASRTRPSHKKKEIKGNK